MARLLTTRTLTGPHRGPRVRRCDDWDPGDDIALDSHYSTATVVVEEDDAAGVLVWDHRGRPLIASVRARVGFTSPASRR